jgi:glycerol-3-phosphate dehydrogenase
MAQGGGAVDLLVVGGGVNGTGIARDAAGRGLSVALVEQGDLAGATSSASSKLIHGGLRYLEYYEFRLVREALHEREVLLASAPHLIRPLRFVLPHHAGLRPAWMLRLGLVLYDHLGGRRSLPGTRTVLLRKDVAGAALKPGYRLGFEYSDAAVDDARLVVLLALDAHERGARILTGTRLVEARREGGVWRAVIEGPGGARETVAARALANAGGPWAEEVLGRLGGASGHGRGLKLVKGSHIVVPRLYEGEHAYTLQSADGRVVFAIPYQDRFTLIGTTDVPFEGDPATVAPSPQEIAYLCGAVDDYFAQAIAPADVAWAYAGVRPLYDDGKANASAVTRDYVLDLEGGAGEPPLLTVYGGKITTFRRLSEHALELLQPRLGFAGQAWTGPARIPGGEFEDFGAFRAECAARWPWLPEPTLTRFARAYGTRIERVLDGATAPAAMGRDYGAGLTEREVTYLIDREWARDPDDILWRRTKLGLHMSPDQRAAFADLKLGG